MQFFFKCVLDPKEELLVDDQKFCKGLFFNSIIEENIEQSINSICEANVIVTNALKMAWGNGYIDNVDNLEFFHKLYIFYSECNDYFISNPENN